MTVTDDPATPPPAPPLGLLQPSEITQAVEILTAAGRMGDDVTIRRLAVHEPGKAELAAGTASRGLDVWLYHAGERRIDHLVVDLSLGGVVVEQQTTGDVPMVGIGELMAVAPDVLRDERVVAALRRRGVLDLDTVSIDPWPTGNFGLAHEAGRRVQRCLFFHRAKPEDNQYAKPVDGLVAFYDIDAGTVVHVDDIGDWSVPTETSNFDAQSVGALRTDLTAIEITQPDGPSFTVTDTNLVEWQNWSLRVLMDHAEGLVLHSVAYRDGDRLRPIVHRASLAEMVVPYGDQRPTQSFKNALDIGEFGLGRLVNSLTLGCDCLGAITYLDTCWAHEDGTPVEVSQGICIHEEDFGILWKHTDVEIGRAEVRRSRRLVVSSIHTVGNYDYGIFWYLYLDGRIQLEVKLTGIVTPMAARDADPGTATQVAPEVAGAIHQHLFCARLDMAVDGHDNTVSVVDVAVDPPGPANPLANGFRTVATPLRTERQAIADVDVGASRTWRISSSSARNRLGAPTAYTLVPCQSATLYPGPESVIHGRAGFATHSVWVTPTRNGERFPAGDHPTQSPPDGRGLPAWTVADRPIADTDVTLWHTFGTCHVVRVEDYPVMPVEYVGFSLVPYGFFDRNPALDVPPSPAHCD